MCRMIFILLAMIIDLTVYVVYRNEPAILQSELLKSELQQIIGMDVDWFKCYVVGRKLYLFIYLSDVKYKCKLWYGYNS